MAAQIVPLSGAGIKAYAVSFPRTSATRALTSRRMRATGRGRLKGKRIVPFDIAYPSNAPFDGPWDGGMNRRPELLEAASGIGRERRSVCPHPCSDLPGRLS
jgi:hypothetical protein